MESYAAFLMPVDLFAILATDECRSLAQHFVIERFEADAAIFAEGERGRKMYVICAGSVAVTRGSGDLEVFLASLGAGEYFGESALFEDSKRTANVMASEPTELLSIDRASFEHFLKEQPVAGTHLLHQMLKLLWQRLHQTSAELQFARLGTVAESADGLIE